MSFDHWLFLVSADHFKGKIFLSQFQIGLSPVGLLIGVYTMINFGWFVATNTLLTIFLEEPEEEGGYAMNAQQNAACMFSFDLPGFALEMVFC